MSILTASNLAKSFGPDDIFNDVTVEIPHKARIALVGPNGAGKTTMLHLLLDMATPSAGSVSRAKGLRIGFLPQRPELLGAHTLREELMSGLARVMALETEVNAAAAALADTPDDAALIARFGDLSEQFEAAGGYTYEARVKMVMQGLNFTPEDAERPLSMLSGGQKTRALLGRLLLEQPDLLALDEPTNHLDINAIEWLEGYLREFPGAVLVVSHDRYFMDAVATTIWELDFGVVETYRGTYSHYVQQREERHERRFKEYEAQQAFIAKEEEYIRRNLAGQNVAQAKGRRTRLQRLMRDDLVRKPRSRRDMSLKLGETMRSGDQVLMTRGLHVGYPGKPLFTAPDITLRRQEVAALIGANGAGKSTFVKTALGDIQALGGEIRIGASVKIGYFAQAHEALDPKNTLIDELYATKAMPVSQARAYLGAYLFSDDDVFRKVETLSGGERGRLALAKLALEGANLLLLDEPTNHLDIASQEILQNVLADFDGTILLVSHDRYLVAALATQIWAVSPGRLDVFNGGYSEYLAWRDGAQKAAANGAAAKHGAKADDKAAKANKTTAHKSGLNPFQRQKRLETVEASIHELEVRLEALNAALSSGEIGGDAVRVAALGAEYMQTEAALHAIMIEWETLVD
ncbi:MAG: ABC-F family ATP-binding cassette domain-containing protein [Chloroflexota bacterium]|nr:ABC-F family ATP-binding cassette domain-containing protein [Chloroflexota bacterium]